MESTRKQAKLKRRMHRKKRAEDKRKAGALPVVLLESGQESSPVDGSKMSDALEQVARPLLENMPDELGLHGTRTAVLMAAASWNAAVTHSPEETEQALQELARLFANDSPTLEKLTLPFLRLLAERKRQLFPRDDRLIMEVNVEDRGDHFYLTASSMRRPPGSSQRSG
ncbi:hypothetical protein [Hyalangium gracile]|uniref:hypothetical protein n=1 Tax=Hyalangium gracile TaxID=394092 RepID=UPI001CC9A51D|nr:hypothetical protein [Hyalangium gracile]